VENDLRRLEGRRPSSQAFRGLYFVWKNPWMVAGSGTYIADLLRLAGGTLSLEESPSGVPADYPVTPEEAVIASRPDVLILPDEPYRFREEDAAHWRLRLPASSRVVLVPGDDWCWHGVRTLRGLAAAEALAASIPVEA
jgi:ABC-type Fe3+-hydroxamate transport system substrate-binding protein